MTSFNFYFVIYVYSSQDCTSSDFKEHFGVIESPNHPESYPGRTDCHWKIQAPLGNWLKFSFVSLKFRHEKDDPCVPNNLTVRNRNSLCYIWSYHKVIVSLYVKYVKEQY